MNPFRYTGREYDPETQLYYYRARYYDPSLARFVSEDPIGQNGGTNQYTYASNNPINRSDPSGTDAKPEDQAGRQCIPYMDSRCPAAGGGGPLGDVRGFTDFGYSVDYGMGWGAWEQIANDNAVSLARDNAQRKQQGQWYAALAVAAVQSANNINFDVWTKPTSCNEYTVIGSAGTLSVQMYQGRVVWGIYMSDPNTNDGWWWVNVWVGLRRVDAKMPPDQSYAPHGTVSAVDAKSGSIFTVHALHFDTAGKLYLSIPNGCIIP